MDALPQQEVSSVISSIAVVRRAWLEAVKDSDVERLVALVTDDVVVVHGNGRCVRGREEVRRDFLKGCEAFSIEQDVSNPEVVVRGQWAFEISEVESTLTPHRGGDATHVHATTIVALNQQSDGSWKVSRVVGLVQP
jgi:uncharacterized protein (TIGR02246 family)